MTNRKNLKAEAPAVAEITEVSVKEIGGTVARNAPVQNSEGVAASWKNPVIAAARRQRYGVKVNDTEYTSIVKAFAAVFPQASISAHQKFRAQLRDAKQLRDHKGNLWQLI